MERLHELVNSAIEEHANKQKHIDVRFGFSLLLRFVNVVHMILFHMHRSYLVASVGRFRRKSLIFV